METVSAHASPPPQSQASGHQRESLNLYTEPPTKMGYTYEKIHPGIRKHPENQSSLQGQPLPVGSQVAATSCRDNREDGWEGHTGEGLLHMDLTWSEGFLSYTILSQRNEESAQLG